MLKTRNGDSVGSRIECLVVAIPDACAMIGIGRSKLYQLLADGEIESVRVGKRRLVIVDSLRELLSRLAAEQQDP